MEYTRVNHISEKDNENKFKRSSFINVFILHPVTCLKGQNFQAYLHPLERS